MISKLRRPSALWFVVTALALFALVRSDLAHLKYVAELSTQGSPPPARDANSPTGYALGQRHFLGAQERGETYRWIAFTQSFVANGPFASPVYHGDTVPTGRPQLLPKFYAGWLAGIAWTLHLFTGETLALSVERAALWEPLISHVLAFLGAALWLGRRSGPVGCAVAGLIFAFFPALSGQFLPGVLTPRTWALLLAAYAIVLNLPEGGARAQRTSFGWGSALAAALALWLDPALGFPAVLLVAVGGAAMLRRGPAQPFLRWSLVGAGVTFAGWLIDQGPFAPSAGELRYVHPWYALAWLGLGLLLHGIQAWLATGRRALRIAEVAAGALLLLPLFQVQIKETYAGWWYASGWLRRLTSLNDTVAFNTLFDWLGAASTLEVFFLGALPLAAAVMLIVVPLRRRQPRSPAVPADLRPALMFAALGMLAFFKIRWGVVATLVAVPLIGSLAASEFASARKALFAAAAVFFGGLVIWNGFLPVSFQRPAIGREASSADVEALVHRHFSHWLATHTPPQSVAALAPPELSDSLVFHGGCRVLMSTAWESYPGQIAATRILSALESTEAEAVIEGHELTHLILPSWDKVLPLFVRKPGVAGKDTLYERLNRWVSPPYLQPVPYHLPPRQTSATEKLAVFKVTPPQDEALALSRLAEYFVEMERQEPAELAGRILAEAHPNDPNAIIARAGVHALAKNAAGFERELAHLAADVTAERAPFSWDRRVQRAIVLALGRRPELARKEIEACLATATRESVFELTPLQAYRLQTLARRFRASFKDPSLAELLASLGAEFSPASPASRSSR